MTETNKLALLARWLRRVIPGVFARALGVGPERKSELFLDLSRAATLKDVAYWLQIVFSAGIATLGLVLNSPAVIIGAMLISPLMNPILAAGLALASGNLVLAVRASVNLVLSCAAAIGFATLLVVLLPFREMTSEILSRTQPNVLDLLIALFSGAIGSVAICREVKGVVTSIPGVAIAVALMPPLSVVGYGIGLMLVFDTSTGWRIASGGGLLFLTNLVAITLTAMLVFMALRIDTKEVRKAIEDWEPTDRESSIVINAMRRFPGLENARKIHSVPLRLGMILLPMVLILVPLSSSFNQLKTEIAMKRRESGLRKAVTEVWQQSFQNNRDGDARSSVDHLDISEKDGTLDIKLRVFDDVPYTKEEKSQCAALIAERLNRPVNSVRLSLVEIPTVSVLDSLRHTRQEIPAADPSTPAAKLANVQARVDAALADLQISPPAKLVRHDVVAGSGSSIEVRLVYMSSTRLEAAAETLIIETLAERVGNDPDVKITLRFLPSAVGGIRFGRSGSDFPIATQLRLDLVGRMMSENPPLTLVVALASVTSAGSSDRRFSDVVEYLGTRWQIQSERIKLAPDSSDKRNSTLRFELGEASGVAGTIAPQ